MGKKFIPNGDVDFVTMAENFARTIAAEPGRVEIAQSDSDELSASVMRFRAALQACRFGGRSQAGTRAKDEARDQAERIIRRLGHLVRSNPRIDAATKMSLGIRERQEKAKVLACPAEPPRLRFVRALHEGTATPMHELEFSAWNRSMAKPAGAVRLELFVDLIPPDEAIPAHPGVSYAGRPWYLRSFTRSPVKLAPPMTHVLMRVVYWGRWADSSGGVGPFSATAVAWCEGGSHQMLPGGTGLALGGRKPVSLLEDAATSPAVLREAKYSVALLEVQYRSLQSMDVTEAASEPVHRESRRIEGPGEGKAA